MKKFGKKALSMLLVALMVVSIFPMTKIEAEAARDGVWKSDYKYWGQYSSADRQMSDYGCWVVADAKMIYETGINRSSDFNPDVLKDYYRKIGAVDSGFWKTGDSGVHVVTYAKSLGNNKLQYLGKTSNNCINKINENISKGYYSILCVNGGGHYVLVSNQHSINNGSIWIYESISTKYSGYEAGSCPKKNNYTINAVYTYSYDGGNPPPPVKDSYIDESATRQIGTYKSKGSGVYIRAAVGTVGIAKVGYIPSYTEVYVSETKYNWGKVTYNGVTGWCCLNTNMFDFKKATTPGTPSLNANTTDLAVGKNITLTWSAASDAAWYRVTVSGAESKQMDVSGTSANITLNNVGTYNFSVKAFNSADIGGSPSSTISCTTHPKCTVTIKDYNGKEIEKKYVDYGGDISIQAPSREGYTFQGWDGSTHGITKDITLTPIYKINTYNVKFWGYDDKQLGETQKVTYGGDATPPADTGAPENYEFVNWSSEDYKNVYTKADDKTINIYAIYKWANENIPITCEITEAYRDKEGYHVMYNLKNNVSKVWNGRAIITLKTAEGKLVYTTESKAFSMPGNSEKNNIDEFFECDTPASVIEIIVVNSYTSGIPLSKSVSKTVTNGLGWSTWYDVEKNEDIPAGAETQTVYRYRDKETTKANTKTLSGWNYNGIASQSSSSGSSWNPVYAVSTDAHVRTVSSQSEVSGYNNKTQYRYSHWAQNGSHATPEWSSNHYEHFSEWSDVAKTPKNTLTYNGRTYNRYWNGSTWGYCPSCGKDYLPWYVEHTQQVPDYNSPIYQNKYYYTDTYYTYSFWRWKDWSNWDTNPVTETAARDVETKIQYRTYNGVEDTTGTALPPKKYYVGTDFAGKQATLFIYKFDAASDYTDEYVGQVQVDNDGYCTFSNIKLREEPSIKTGDMTFALGIEGTTNTFVVETLEAPKPTYTVNFYDWDGTIIETQTVTEGESAILPAYIPEKEGYDFIGWSDTLTNVREDRDIFADMEKKEYQVIFVDWENQLIEVKTFAHGDVLVTPDFAQVEGYTFAGWDAINEGKAVVTGNMVVTAQYDANVYTVKFCDYDGNIIDVQEVEYGKTALPPEDVESADDKQFAGWYDPENYEYVEHDVTVFPAYYYEETANTPVANYESGEYNESLKLTLTTDDENEVIFYYLNGDLSTEAIYTDPIDITKTTAVTYYSSCINKNDSEETTQYYCINTSDQFSAWMPYDSLPEDVRVNTKDYNLENADGYRYKNTVKTSSVADAADYVADGWEYLSDEYSAYSAWQDTEIKVDNSLIGFEVATQQVADSSVTRYQYSHYKYTDANGVVCYSPKEVSGFDCEYETVIVDNRLSIGGILDDENGTSYYNYNGAQWFTQTKVPGEKTQYRSRYKINSYYKWSDWGINGPTALETREYETSTVYRYSNKIYHIVTVNTGFYERVPQIFMIEHGTILDVSSIERDGFDLSAVYTDSDCTEVFENNEPITESVLLYAKYTPKTYTVRFQMQDGTELDTQTVSYMESAVAPETDVVEGYVFSKWDKDFSCITEDTVVTGRYYKESDYARITLDRTVLDMFQGNDVKLNYTISPANLSGEAVEWSSSDPSIATVDDKGVVTALLPGEATITAMVTKTRETATCRVIVNEDCGNYIVLTANSTLNHDSLGYLRRIGFNTSVDNALVNFRNDNLEFYNIEGTKLIGSSKVGTGTTIVLKNGENVLDKETIVITGDMTGDGLLNNRDVAMVNRYLVNKVTPQECQVVALDLNGDGYINNKDAAMAARYLVGKDAII